MTVDPIWMQPSRRDVLSVLAVVWPAGGRKGTDRPKRILHGLLGCLFFVAWVGSGCADRQEENVEQFLRDASSLVASGRQLEQTSYVHALALYVEAVTKLETIVSKYPSSPVAERLARNEAEIDGFTLGELKQVVLPQTRRKAEAESSPLACATFLAQPITTPAIKVPLLIRIAAAYVKKGQMRQAQGLLSQSLEMADAVKESESRADMEARIAGLYAEAGQFGRAVEIARRIDDAGIKVRAMAEISIAYGRAGRSDAASETLSRALHFINEPEQVDSRQRALAAIAAAYAKMGQYARVLEIAQTMTDPDNREEALAGIAGEYQVARVSDKALKSAKTVEYFRTSTLAAVAGKVAEAGRFQEAMDIAQAIENPEDKAQAFAWVARQQARQGEKRRAEETLDLAFEQATSIEVEQERGMILLSIADQYLEADEKAAASEVLSQVLPLLDRMGYFTSRVQAHVALSFARAGAYDRAREITRLIEEAGAKASALVGLAGEWLDAGEREQAVAVLRQSLLTAKTIQDTATEERTLAEIAEMNASAGRCNQALSLAQSIGDPRLRSRVLAEIAVQYAVDGQKGQAAKTLEQALMTARNLEGAPAKAGALAEIAAAWARTRQTEKVRKTLYEATEAATAIKEDRERAMTLVGIVDAYAGVGQAELALATIPAALRAALSVEDAPEKTDILIEIADACLQAKGPEQAAHVLGQAVETAKTIQDSYERSLFLVRIANGLYRAGWTAQSRERLVESLEGDEMISNELQRARVLAEIAVQFADAGEYEQGLRLAQRITGYDAEVLADVAGRYAEAGYLEEARKTLSRAFDVTQQIKDAERHGNVLLLIAKKWRETGDEHRAAETLSEASRVAGAALQGPARGRLWAGIAVEYAQLGQQNLAVGTAQGIQDLDEKARVLSEIALSYGQRGTELDRGDEASKFLHAMIVEAGTRADHQP